MGEDDMKLTGRRREFLEHIYEQFKENNHPVHYSDIAEAVGVSKWTSYDVLKGLESQGFLKKTYSNNESGTGRSIVVFSPTKMTEQVFQKERREIWNTKEWETILMQVNILLEN